VIPSYSRNDVQRHTFPPPRTMCPNKPGPGSLFLFPVPINLCRLSRPSPSINTADRKFVCFLFGFFTSTFEVPRHCWAGVVLYVYITYPVQGSTGIPVPKNLFSGTRCNRFSAIPFSSQEFFLIRKPSPKRTWSSALRLKTGRLRLLENAGLGKTSI